MTYYILPKTNNSSPQLNPIFYDTQSDSEHVVISNSIQLRRDILLNQISTISRNNSRPRQKLFLKKTAIESTTEHVMMKQVDVDAINSKEREVVSSLPTSLLPTSLLPEFTEIIGIFNISEVGKCSHPYEFLNFSCLTSPEISCAINCHAKITSPKTSLQLYAVNLKRLNLDLNLDAMFFDVISGNQLSSYSHDLICALFVILKSMSSGGTTIIKMSAITLQLELDVVHILNYAFDKVYVLKPDSSNIVNDDKYIVCKHFLKKRSTALVSQLVPLIESHATQHLGKLLRYKLPYTFLIKMEEINVIIGQKQMDGLCQMINTVKHKSNENKMEQDQPSYSWHKTTNAFNQRLFKHTGKPESDQTNV
jgi:hypothetical protein